MKKISIYLILILFYLLYSCVEPYELATETFEDTLVINATITNEYKYQEINLSRTFKLEEREPTFEKNAVIKIVDDLQNTHNFKEASSGKYLSILKFKAELGRTYQLYISTHDNKSYTSTKEQMNSIKGLDSIYPIITLNHLGKEGIAIVVDSYDSSGKSNYYRYEYEETFKIVAPYAQGLDAYEITYTPPVVGLRPRNEEKRVCYKTTNSNTIIQTQTTNLSEDRISKHQLKFIENNNYITTYGYSILVKQYIQSLEAYSFYRTLKKISQSGNIFSQTQPGSLEGNIHLETNSNEKVLGFFEISSVSFQRIFFKYRDFYPNKPFPKYLNECYLTAPELTKPSLGIGSSSPLLDALNSGDWVYYDDNPNPTGGLPGPMLLIQSECGECTAVGSNIKPEFWID